MSLDSLKLSNVNVGDKLPELVVPLTTRRSLSPAEVESPRSKLHVPAGVGVNVE